MPDVSVTAAGIVVRVTSFLFGPLRKAWAYKSRKKLSIQFKTEIFKFKSDSAEYGIPIPNISIKNTGSSQVIIVSNSLFLDNNRFPTGGGNDLKTVYEMGAKPVLPKNMELMYAHYVENDHFNIESGHVSFTIDPGHTKIFPIVLSGAGITNLFSIKKDSDLFFKNGLWLWPSSKMSVRLNVDDKNCEYGLNRENAYAAYLNYFSQISARDGGLI